MTVWLIANRAISYCFGSGRGTSRFSRIQSYSSRLFSNSRVQMECVTRSMLSPRQCAKSYIG